MRHPFGKILSASFTALALTMICPTSHAATPLCTQGLTICARPMQPLGVPLGGHFTVQIDDHYKATYECIMQNGQPRWVPTAQQGSCVPQPVILLPAKYDTDDPWNVG